MASWCPDLKEALDELEREVPRYLAAVDTFIEEGCPPTYTNEGEFVPDAEYARGSA